MAHTYAIKARGASGELHERIVDITFVDNYATGGFPLAAKDLGFGTNGVIMFVDAAAKAGYAFEYDQVNQRLKVYANAAGAGPLAELANASAALAGAVLRCFVMGKGSPG